MSAVRRLLFVAYWVPPRRAIGTIRAAHLLKHLPDLGWDVTVLTAKLGSGEPGEMPGSYVQTGYCNLKGLVKRSLGIGERSTHEALNVGVPKYGSGRTALQSAIFTVASLLSYPDEYAGWLPFAAAGISRTLRNGGWDAVLTTAPPMTVNLAAALARSGVPWIADFRDLWAEGYYSEHSFLHALLDDKLERLSLRRAAVLTASSERSAARLQRRYATKPCVPIYNGFDEDEWCGVPFESEERCTLLYAGNWYRGQRDPSVLFAALRELFEQRLADPDDLRVDLYGPHEEWLSGQIASFGLAGVVAVRGLIEREAVLRAQRRADRLLVFSWDAPASDGVVPGKLFEYFGARRPILAVGGPAESDVAQLLQRTGAGVHCRTVGETKDEICRAIEEHRRGAVRIVPEAAVRDYSGRTCAQRFAAVLNCAVNARESQPRRLQFASK